MFFKVFFSIPYIFLEFVFFDVYLFKVFFWNLCSSKCIFQCLIFVIFLHVHKGGNDQVGILVSLQ